MGQVAQKDAVEGQHDGGDERKHHQRGHDEHAGNCETGKGLPVYGFPSSSYGAPPGAGAELRRPRVG